VEFGSYRATQAFGKAFPSAMERQFAGWAVSSLSWLSPISRIFRKIVFEYIVTGFLGTNKNIAEYDLYKDTQGNVFVKGKGGVGEVIQTGLEIN
jgi:hypothetical protein